MDGYNSNKKYEAFKIPGQQQLKLDGAATSLPQTKPSKPISLDEGMYYEIEYDSGPMPGVGKFVLKSQRIQEPEKDEKRELFGQMRDISRTHRSIYDSSRFFDQRVQNNNAMIFYKQGMLMKDFSDDFTGDKPYSQYFPCYQMMGYEQLRTYFTWRTKVRNGNIADISLSYAFLYIYELLSNIGVSDPLDGLNKLMSFWGAFSIYNKSIDKYVLRWLKDYHIYYELPHSFREFVDTNNLAEFYPKMMDTDDSFELFCSISRYDIRKSTFFTDDNIELIKDCFSFIIEELKRVFADCGIDFDKAIFQPTRKMSEWKPFKGALFSPWLRQEDRRVVLSEKEIYICSNNKWAFTNVITSKDGRQLIGYIMKQMEVALRKATRYKFKLSANISTITHGAIDKLRKAGLSLETIVNDGVDRFYKEATKTVVIVDHEALSRIRQEALVTQEKLYVPEQDKLPFVPLATVKEKQSEVPAALLGKPLEKHVPIQEKPLVPVAQDALEEEKPLVPVATDTSEDDKLFVPAASLVSEEEKPFIQIAPDTSKEEQLSFSFTDIKDMSSTKPHDIQKTPVSDIWESLKDELTQIETKALSVLMHGEMELKKYADDCGIMLEVLVDGINEKAMDYIGDNLIDEEFVLYDDYKEQVKELIR